MAGGVIGPTGLARALLTTLTRMLDGLTYSLSDHHELNKEFQRNMSTVVGTVAGSQEAEGVVQRLLMAGVRASDISVMGAQGVPLSLPEERRRTFRAQMVGILLYATIGAVAGLVMTWLLAVNLPGLGQLINGPHSLANHGNTAATFILAGLGFGAVTGFLATAVAGEESTAPYAERLRPGELAIVVDARRREAMVRSILGLAEQTRPAEALAEA